MATDTTESALASLCEQQLSELTALRKDNGELNDEVNRLSSLVDYLTIDRDTYKRLFRREEILAVRYMEWVEKTACNCKKEARAPFHADTCNWLGVLFDIEERKAPAAPVGG